MRNNFFPDSEMTINSEKPKPSVAYIPFKTFTNFIDRLNSSAVPPVIDTSILLQMSGSMRSQLMSALRSMHLIDDNGNVQPSLNNLVSDYNTDIFQQSLKDIISQSYDHVVKNVDINSGTAKQLTQAFRENGNVDGQMLEKAIRFYLAALKETGILVSPHFTIRKPRKPRVKKPKTNANHDQHEDDNDDGDNDDGETTAGRIKWRLPIRNKGQAIISLPEDITPEEWHILKIQLDAFIIPNTGKTP